MSNWLELSVSADIEAAEAVTELLARYAPNGSVVLEPPWQANESEPGETSTSQPYLTDSTRPVLLRIYLAEHPAVAQTCREIEQALWHLGRLRPVGPLQVRTVSEEDWANAWKEHYQVQHITERLVLVPSWLDYTAQPHELTIALDPGMAFGTGLHPTTRLCLRLLEQQLQPGMRVLDLGTGSGILAIAAAKMGAVEVWAIDNDPVAVRVASENVAHNQCSEPVRVLEGSIEAASGHFDLILANIIANVLMSLADGLTQALAPNGTLISSGIIDERETEVALALATTGLHLHARQRDADWVALVHRHQRPGS
ncbi:MAG: 50S ribosomal protein L11 methyltransferase [Chloroflexaceae bacterium]|nr:50S ribosomal protein L11 methyltransferase [Chloroflexaceae bacterium]